MTVQLTEFSRSANSSSGAQMQMAELPAVTSQTVAVGAESVQSAVFNAATTYVRVKALAACHITSGVNPTATTSMLHLSAGAVEYFGVRPGHRLAVIGE